MKHPLTVRTAGLRRIALFSLTALLAFDAGAQNTLDLVGLTYATPALPAYSLRKLSSSYSGNAVNVRRGSDGASSDIGFTASGDLDTVALQSFVGVNNGFVVRWYDQSGSGVDAFQATQSLQPRLVASGIIERLNGQPAIYFGTANLATSALTLYPTACSMVGCAKGNQATPSAFVTKTGTSGGSNLNFPAPFDFTNDAGLFTVGDASLSSFSNYSTASTTPASSVSSSVAASVYSFVITGASGTASNYLNGAPAGAGAVGQFADNGAPLRIGNRNDGTSAGEFWATELILFSSALPFADRNTAEANLNSYYGLQPCLPIHINTQPVGDSVCLGSNYTFSVSARGTIDSYQWRRNGVDVGSNSNTLFLSNISASDTGSYTCTMTNACEAVTTVPARLTLPDLTKLLTPGITGTTAICAGSTTTLTAHGGAGYVYRWYTDSVGGVAVFEGPVFTTPVLSASTYYYLSAELCGQHASRRGVLITALPSAAINASGVVATPGFICSGRSALTASVDTSLGQQVYWYDAPTGGNLLGVTNSGDSFWVNPSVTTTYYAQSGPRKATVVYEFTGVEEIFRVPAGVGELEVAAYGGCGGGMLGVGGGSVKATLKVLPGDSLGINVGQQAGPFGGGGIGDQYQGNGGGATDIRSRPGGSLYERIVVAGGGGAGNYRFTPGSIRRYTGGGGGGLIGGTARNLRPDIFTTLPGTGGSQTAGGLNGGAFGVGHGGGGGGWYGGGGLSRYGGGGGSSYTDPYLATNVIHEQNVWTHNGKLVISYTTYSACTNGRVPVTVTVRTRPTVTASVPVYSCPGSPVTLTATGADNYVWQPGNLSGSSVSVNPIANTNYTVIGIDNNSNCADTAQTTITTEFSATTDTVCVGGTTSATLQDLPPGATVSWYTAAAGGGSLLGTGVTIGSLGVGTYYPRVTLPCGIVEAHPVTILNGAQVPFFLGGDSVLCPGTKTTLYASGFGSGSGLAITQPDPLSQPRLILQSGVAARPVLRFTPTQFMQVDTPFTAPYSISITARQTGGTRGRVLSGIRNNWLLGWNGDVQARAYFEGWVQENGYSSNNLFQVYTATSDGGQGTLRENSTILAQNSGGVAAPEGLQLNGWVDVEGSDCEIAELLVFGAVFADSTQTFIESGAHQYFIAPDSLLVTAPEFGHTKTYTVTAASTQCGTSVSGSITVRSAAKGDPTEFGSDSWNVYAWTAGSATINPASWNEGYSGFYNASGLDFNTTGSWPAGAAPSSAAGYQGCAVSASLHSWSAKRKGFPCSYYSIDVTSHEAGQLWINGVKVWEHDATGDSHTSVWIGSLGASDSVEFRATRSGSAIGSGITFTPTTPAFSYAITHMCDGRDTLLPNINVPRGVFSSTPAGLNIDAATGVISSGAVGIYTITYTLPGCAGPAILTAPLRISIPVSDPSVYGTNSWNVYVWNSGGTRSTVGGTWVANYTGTYTAPGLNFNSADQWASGTPPSSAAGYQGCPVGADQNSWMAKREGFPCGHYRIDIPRHDDGAYLYINDVRV
ncbi:MAG: hypothetical protein EOO15_18760, partial [Chitinophagaceae bacterium]